MKKQGIQVLHLIDHMGFGGAQKIVAQIVENQPKSYLVSLRKSKNTVKVSTTNYKEVSKFKSFIFTKSLIEKNNFKIIHCHLLKSFVYGYLLKLFYPDIKLVFHLHNSTSLTHWLHRLFIKLTESKVDLYIAVSKSVLDEITIQTSSKKAKLLNNFVDTKYFSGSVRSLNDDMITLGYVGRLSEIKGCKYLLQALPKLKFEFNLIVCGTGEKEEELKKVMHDLGLSKKVKFIGYHVDVKEIYQLIDILVVPSINEAFGLSAIESQSMGVPVVASKVGGLSNILTHKKNALLFKSKDLKDMADKLNTLILDKQLYKTLSTNGLENSQRYCYEAYSKKLNQIYEDIL